MFHVASPVAFATTDPQKELIEPALKVYFRFNFERNVKGTQNVLTAVEKNRDTVKRVVVTSSIAAITNMNDLGKTILDKDRIFTESDWNLTSNLKDGPYRFSKRLSEEATWDWYKKTGIETVTVLPSLVIGKLLNSRTKKEDLNFSMAQLKRYMDGEAKYIAPGMQ